jgi:hypothetical protein
LKSKGWAKSTSGTYRTHLKTYLEFCGKYDLEPVPCTTKTVELYIAFLVDVKKFAFSSIRSYVNIISVLHKSHDAPDPIDYKNRNWQQTLHKYKYTYSYFIWNLEGNKI